MLQVSYGIKLREYDDKYYKMIERLAEVGEGIAVPGRFLVEALPWLRHLPMWVPGAEFKSYAAEAKRDILHIVDQLFGTAKAAMVSCTSCVPRHSLTKYAYRQDNGQDSLVSRLLDATSLDTENKLDPYEVCKGVAVTLYAGVYQTSLLCFLVCSRLTTTSFESRSRYSQSSSPS